MRKIYSVIGAVAAAAICFISCQKAEVASSGAMNTHTLTFQAVQDDLTRTALDGQTAVWVPSDASQFNVYELNVKSSGDTVVQKASSVSVSFEGGRAAVTATFPDVEDATPSSYRAFVGHANSTGNASLITIQTASSASFDPSADILFAQELPVSEAGSAAVEMRFRRMVAVGKMTLDGILSGETVSKVELKFDNAFQTSFYAKTEPSKYGQLASSSEKSLTVNVSGSVVYFTIGAVTGQPVITVTTDKAVYTKKFARAISFKANELHSFTVAFSASDRKVADKTYLLVKDASELSAGDEIVLGCAAKSVAAGPMDVQKYFSSVDASIEDGVLTSASAIGIVLGGSAGAWTLTTSEGKVGTSEVKSLSLNNDSAVNTWTISVTPDGVATVASTNSDLGQLAFNSSSPRFLNYASGQTSIEIYKLGVLLPRLSAPVAEASASGEHGISVTWKDVENASSYKVRCGSEVKEVAAGQGTCSFTGLEYDSYEITVTAVADGYRDAESAKVTVTLSDPSVTTVSDVLTLSLTGLSSGAGYTSWSGKSGTSGAVYAGCSAGQYGTIQLRSKNSDSGIYTTASGGYICKVSVVWNSKTPEGRTLGVYGSNTAYSSVADLYDVEECGTLLGEIVCGTNTEIPVSGAYRFVAVKSQADALYLEKITFEWSKDEPETVAVTGITLDESSLALNVGDNSTLTATVLPSDASNKSVKWTSTSETVATVSGGVVTAVGAGTAEITATTMDGSFSAKCTVTVTSSGGTITGDKVWTLVTDASSIKSGDVIVIASSEEGSTAGAISSTAMEPVTSTFSSDKSTIETLGNGTVKLKVGGTSGAWTLADESGRLLGATAAKKLAWESGTTTWSISISGGAATIQNGTSSYGRFLYNVNSPRFAPYTSATTVSMLLPQIYRAQ